MIAAASDEPLPAEALESEHPLFIGYTSGTTGRPKGVLHVHGGFLVKIASEVAYQADLHPGDPALGHRSRLDHGAVEIVGALALGSTVFLYDGAPTHPAPDRLWSLVHRHRITTLGVSPTLIARSSRRERTTSADTTCRRCGSSPRRVSRGTPTPTSGCTGRSAARVCRSST